MIVNTDSGRTAVIQEFINNHQIATKRSGAKVIKLDNDTAISVKR